MRESFTLKTIQIAITLGQGTFSRGGTTTADGRTKLIEGLACEVRIQKPGLPHKNQASVKIWGLKLEDMTELTMLAFNKLEWQHNLISIKAGEQGSLLPLVFQGEITSAFADFNSAPDVCMQFEAASGSYPQQIAASPLTTDGEALAERLFAQFTAEAGYAFVNEGVTSSVRNACFPGSPIDKMKKLARDIGCELIIDDGTVIVLPAGAARQGDPILLTKDNGLIGYPTFNQDGISCRCLFNPNLRHHGLIEVQSIVPRASGIWKINGLSHSISAYQPSGGSWETQIEAVPK